MDNSRHFGDRSWRGESLISGEYSVSVIWKYSAWVQCIFFLPGLLQHWSKYVFSLQIIIGFHSRTEGVDFNTNIVKNRIIFLCGWKKFCHVKCLVFNWKEKAFSWNISNHFEVLYNWKTRSLFHLPLNTSKCSKEKAKYSLRFSNISVGLQILSQELWL